MAVHRGYSSKGEQVSHGCPGIITDCIWGDRGNGVVLFLGKEGKRGSLPWLCEKRSFGDGCHSVLMGLSFSSYEALIQWR